jgi:hypothetical protein
MDNSPIPTSGSTAPIGGVYAIFRSEPCRVLGLFGESNDETANDDIGYARDREEGRGQDLGWATKADWLEVRWRIPR